MASSTYLSYCITVTNESLLYATEAHAGLDGPFRFFRLVQQRIAHGTLACSAPSPVSRIPTEVWELIQHKLVDKELRRAERVWISKLICDYLWKNEDGCDSCVDVLMEQKGTADPETAQACRAILAKYGLCMPSLQFLQDPVDHKATDSPASPCSKPESLVIIALPPFGVTSAASADEQPSYPTPSVSYDKYFNDAVWNVSFDLPACADDCFRALVRDYHLDVVAVHDGTLALAGTRAEKAGAESSRQVESVKSVRAIQPRWKLFTTVVCDW
ncbi:hypothetical protein BMF94_0750 [Rhodotorula taiwanensis]|uniref:Uncharacterized protein n=1 Tax=Rhodotorula taiwanensis TaxID=741276 RepID=A0A2S5BGY9_9BASI|nr:hypothetical protein BMF94_0750 [Rhodotorula taiwanensis]